MDNIFFYHSFPRSFKNEKDALQKGIKIVRSMVEMGFLLTQEIVDWGKYLKLNEIRPNRIDQKRICFTALNPKELKNHMAKWGIFSLEFNTQNIRLLGAMPVFYVPSVIKKEDQYRFPSQALVKKLLITLSLKNGLPIECGDGIRGLFGLLYPTEDPIQDPELENYRLREWRITGNTVQYLGVTDKLNEEEKQKVKEIDNEFFTDKQLSSCWKFFKLNNKHVLTYATQIIVPDELVIEVSKILKSSINDPPSVTSISDFETQ